MFIQNHEVQKLMKERIYKILTVSEKTGDLSWFFDIFLITLIGLNVLVIILESIVPLRVKYESEFNYFEIFSVVIFSVEYILRLWTANVNPAYRKPFTGNLRYAFTPLAIIDLLAILPFYLPFVGVDLRLLRILRLFRLFRLFKIVRYIKALSLINKVVKEKKEELIISIVFTFLYC